MKSVEVMAVRPEEDKSEVTFMAEYTSFLLNRLELGKDEKTASEGVKGKSATVLGIEFGEKLLWKKKGSVQAGQDQLEMGVRSGEFWVATKAGVNKARSVRRIPEKDRWSEDCVNWVKHVPWHLYKGHPEADGEIPEEKIVETRMRAVRPVNDMESLLCRCEDPTGAAKGISDPQGGRGGAWVHEEMCWVLKLVPQLRSAAPHQRMSCEVHGCHEGGCTIPECREKKAGIRRQDAREESSTSSPETHGSFREWWTWGTARGALDLDDQHRGTGGGGNDGHAGRRPRW